MKILDFIYTELKGWGKYERFLFPLCIFLITYISLLLNDNRIALLSAICGITYTILAGKGKISCYIFGLISTICYSWIAYKNTFYGNLALNLLYYFPMQILGIIHWKKHLKKESHEIIKTKLPPKEQFLYYITTLIAASLTAIILKNTTDSTPYIDAITTTFSILGLILTVKRCIEQWYIWTIVNTLSAIMWIIAYIKGSNCAATIIMWCIYLILGLYFLQTWNKELKTNSLNQSHN